MGSQVVQIPTACRRDVTISAVFQAEDSEAWGLPLARGSRFFAEPLKIDLSLRRRRPEVEGRKPDRKPEAGSRKPEAGSWKLEAGSWIRLH